jgi:hypothetical protein
VGSRDLQVEVDVAAERVALVEVDGAVQFQDDVVVPVER